MVYGKSSSVEFVILRERQKVHRDRVLGVAAQKSKVTDFSQEVRPAVPVFPTNRNSAGATAVRSRLSVHSSPPRIMGGPNMFKVSAKKKENGFKILSNVKKLLNGWNEANGMLKIETLPSE